MAASIADADKSRSTDGSERTRWEIWLGLKMSTRVLASPSESLVTRSFETVTLNSTVIFEKTVVNAIFKCRGFD